MLTWSWAVSAQQVIAPANPSDTIRVIQIVQGKSLRHLTIDTTELETIAGSVIIKEGLTTFSSDSVSGSPLRRLCWRETPLPPESRTTTPQNIATPWVTRVRAAWITRRCSVPMI